MYEGHRKLKCELYNDNFQSWKLYPIHKAQLVIADIPYNVGNNFYGSNPMWYNGGDNKNGESKLAGKAAFNSDFNFNEAEFWHFCHQLLKKEPKGGWKSARGRSSDAPCMIVFTSFERIHIVIEKAAKNGFPNYIPLVFIKNYSPQVLKANMRVVGATEYALLFYQNKLPKFRNGLQIDENGKNIRGQYGKPDALPASTRKADRPLQRQAANAGHEKRTANAIQVTSFISRPDGIREKEIENMEEKQKSARQAHADAVKRYEQKNDRINIIFPAGTRARIEKLGRAPHAFIKEVVETALQAAEKYNNKH